MKRMVVVASLGISLAFLSGCHLHKKHLRKAAYLDGDCGCGATIPASYDAIPSSQVISPLPVGGMPSAPSKGAFPSFQG